jgi:hypothetical protein
MVRAYSAIDTWSCVYDRKIVLPSLRHVERDIKVLLGVKFQGSEPRTYISEDHST